jgi:hypothetical protein
MGEVARVEALLFATSVLLPERINIYTDKPVNVDLAFMVRNPSYTVER